MHTLQQLEFAQHFPFSGAARHIVREENLSLENLPEALVERAELMARHALEGKKYAFEVRQSELLMREILAFPVAKIIVSFSKDPVLYSRFAKMVSNSAYEFLARAKNRKDLAVKLATDFGLEFDFPETGSFFVSMSLREFLSIPFRDASLKLVNQFASRGRVYLDSNDFTRFLAEKSYSTVFSSLPVPLDSVPKRLGSISKTLKQESKKREERLFKEAFKGKVTPDAFPECIAAMYGQLASGQKLPHMANFTLATFLNSIGMPKPRILALFRKSPNFKERIASYQLDRIAKQNYTPPSCDKIKSYGLCPNTECRTKHPLSFYRRKMRQGRAQARPGEGNEGFLEKDAGAKGGEK